MDGKAGMDVSQLRGADLIFVRGTQWINFPVKLVTQSQYTHVAGYVLKGKLIEAQSFRQTGYASVATYQGASDVFRCPHLTYEQMRKIVWYVEREIGSEYDYLLLGWEAVRLVFGVILPYVKNKRRICSTLWADAYKSAGIDLCPGQRFPTPADLVHSRHLRKIGVL